MYLLLLLLLLQHLEALELTNPYLCI